jgi:hypothetical protein
MTIAEQISPEHYPVELVGELLSELKASGVFDRILAEASGF